MIYIDPSESYPNLLKCHSAEHSFYCRICKKKIQGFDHHCSWLNTCIGASNYTEFYFMVTTGSLLMLLKIFVNIMCLLKWFKKLNGATIVNRIINYLQTFSVIHLILSIGGLFSYGSVFGFHSYLLMTCTVII